ncbi:MAG: 6-phosphofructokinase [Oscillospiraceae bacterium]
MGKELTGACIIAQSGGPTAVINASALGVIKTALSFGCITKVYGAAHGIKGVINDVIYDMGAEDERELELLLHTPSSALGSCRYKLKDYNKDTADYERILEVFKKYDVRYFFYNGGNDSMDTCNKISKYMQRSGYECRIIGIPKTIDNDLYGTDFCPGYGSAAKYIASTFCELYQDASVYDTGAITIVEVMGRNAGWLTAAASLANLCGTGPDYVYLPEISFDFEKFIADIERAFNTRGNALVAVSEGVKDRDGKLISEYGSFAPRTTDSFGHIQLGGLAAVLAAAVKERTGKKVRGLELSLLQRCANHLASKVDSDCAYLSGKAAVEAAVSGETDMMVALERTGGGFTAKLIALSSVANIEKTVPLGWINVTGNGIEKEFYDYALPLIQGELEYITENGLPRHARLKKVRA